MIKRRRKLRDQNWEQRPDGVWQPVLLEEHVVKEIITRLWLQAKIKAVRINCVVGGKGRPNEPGIPDLVGYISVPKNPDFPSIESIGRALFIEVKRPGGARRAAQIRFIEEAKAAGCIAFFAESWRDVMRELYPMGYRLSA